MASVSGGAAAPGRDALSRPPPVLSAGEAAARRGSDTVEAGLRAPAPPVQLEQSADEVDPYLGKVVAERYRVIRKLGAGGMGVVYLAEHVFIEKRVALKILAEEF